MKKTVFVVSIVFILCSVFSCFTVSAYTPTFELDAENALLINVDTQDVVYQKNIDERISPASTMFLMVALVTCENTKDLNDVVTIDSSVASSLSGTGALVSLLKDGEQLTVEQLLHFLLIQSYNDVALILADYVSGDIDKFVELMNTTAKRLSMNDSHYASPAGLTRDDQYTTVNDMYKLAKTAFNNETIVNILSKSRYTVDETNLSGKRTLSTTNLMSDISSNYYYKYMKAGKTGNGDEGRCLVSLSVKDSERYLCIVARCKSTQTRGEFSDTKKLVKWAFDNFRYKTIIGKGELVPVSAPVELSWDKDTVTLAAAETVVALLPKDADLSTIEYKAELVEKSFDAPIKNGDVLGTASIVFANEVIGTVELVATEDIGGSAVLWVWRLLNNIFTNPFVIILLILALIAFLVLTIIVNVKAKRAREKKLRLKKRL